MKTLICLLSLLIASNSFADVRTVSEVAVIAAHGADGYSTMYCLAQGSCVERNVWLTRYSTQPAVFGALSMGVGALGTLATRQIPNRRLAAIVNFALTGFLVGVTANNMRVIRSAR